MPHTPSAEKRLRQNEKRRLHNRAVKKAIKLQVKAFLAAVKDGTPEAAANELRLTAKKLDKAAAKRVVHPNLAARKKAQLAKKLHAKQTGGAAAAK
jgi:small subunit ribosomal protein S20